MATSAVSMQTTDQYRPTYNYSNTVDGLLKEVYIPALNNTIFHATPLMQMFGDFGGSIDFQGKRIIKAFKHQGAGTFGGIPEGGNWVTPKHQKGFQGYERIKYLNAYFSLTGPASRTVRQGEGAFVDAISSAMDDTLKLARQQMERIIGGRGDGLICTVTSDGTNIDSSTGDVLTATSGTGAYSPVQWLCEGLRVDLLDSISSPSLVANGGGAIVSAVDYKAGTFTLKAASTEITMSAQAYYLTLENAYGEVEDPENGGTDQISVDVCLEPNGLYNLVDDGTTYASIWNLTRTTYPYSLKSLYTAAGDVEIDEELLIGYILDLVNYQLSTPNVLVTDPRSRLKYFGNRKEDRRFDTTVIDTTFGFKSIGVQIDQYQLILQSLTSLVPGSLFLLNTNDFKFAKATDGFQWIDEGGRILRNKEGSDRLFGTAVNYTNLVCENPRGQYKVDGLATS